MPRPSAPAALLSAIAVVGGAAILTGAGCGSRTGLFGVDLEAAADASTDRTPSTTDASGGGPIACTPGRFAFDLASAQIMFVIDRSGSMNFSLDGQQPSQQGSLPPGVRSRWEELRDALYATILPFDQSLAIGVKFYPEEHPRGSPADVACSTDVGVGIAPARGNTQVILDAFDETGPNGGTPTAEAVRLAARYLTETRGLSRVIIIATDGAPNCNEALNGATCVCTAVATPALPAPCLAGSNGQYNCLDDERAIGAIREIAEVQQIPVYVVGIGGTEKPEFLEVLDEMAVAGGRARPTVPRHYNVQSAAALRDAFSEIQSTVARCTYLTPSAPDDPSAIDVEIDGVPIPHDPSRQNGWDWADRAYGTMTFFGSACVLATMQGAPTVSGVVRCED